MFTGLVTRFTCGQDTVFRAAWRDYNKGVSRTEADTSQVVAAKQETKKLRNRKVSVNRERSETVHHAFVDDQQDTNTDYLNIYNTWLKEHLLQGGRITHFYDYPCPRIEVVTDPRNQRPLSLYKMCGANSRNYILSRDIDAAEHANDFVSRSSHNNMYGWTNGGKKTVTYDGLWVPAYTNTVDREMMHDSSIPEHIRYHIRQGVAEEESGSRAWKIANVLRDIAHQYVNCNQTAFQEHGYSKKRDRGFINLVHALEWYAEAKSDGDAPALSQPTMTMHVDFSKGDCWAFKKFLDKDSDLYHFKDINPVEYLAGRQDLTATFITDKVAVVMDSNMRRHMRTPLIILTATSPAGQGLAGYSYTIASVESYGAWEPVKVTFLSP